MPHISLGLCHEHEKKGKKNLAVGGLPPPKERCRRSGSRVSIYLNAPVKWDNEGGQYLLDLDSLFLFPFLIQIDHG